MESDACLRGFACSGRSCSMLQQRACGFCRGHAALLCGRPVLLQGFTRVCHQVRAGMPQNTALKQQLAVLIKKQRSGGSGSLNLQSARRPTLEPLSAPRVSRAVAGALAGAPY